MPDGEVHQLGEAIHRWCRVICSDPLLGGPEHGFGMLALGGSLQNAVVLDDTRVINREGLRFSDEFVRHKALDLIGDLALLGLPVQGHFKAMRSGHALHHALVAEIRANPSCWTVEVPDTEPVAADTRIPVLQPARS